MGRFSLAMLTIPKLGYDDEKGSQFLNEIDSPYLCVTRCVSHSLTTLAIPRLGYDDANRDGLCGYY